MYVDTTADKIVFSIYLIVLSFYGVSQLNSYDDEILAKNFIDIKIQA